MEVTTSDHITLHGLFYAAKDRNCVAILLHGLGGNFYTQPVPGVANVLAEAGYSCLAINTRGHDWIAGWGTLIGSSLELIADAPYDIEAFVHYLRDMSYERIVLIGHSLGGLKALYYQSSRSDHAITAVVAMSPTFSLSYHKAVNMIPDFEYRYSSARNLVSQGRPYEFIRWVWSYGPTPEIILTAQTFVDRYGPSLKFDGKTLIGKVVCPVLLTAGSKESEDYRSSLAAANVSSLEIVQGADHYYTAFEPALARVIVRWLENNDVNS